MNAIRLVQTAWAVILVALAGLFVSDVRNWVRITSFILAAIYLLACLGTWRNSRSSWYLAVTAPVLICAWCLWWLIYGTYQSLAYGQAPILKIALIYTLPLLLPSLCILGLMWYHRDAVLTGLRYR